MGTNCAPLVADFVLFCYERDFVLFRHLDDLLNIDNPYFEQMVGQIYPTEHQLNKVK